MSSAARLEAARAAARVTGGMGLRPVPERHLLIDGDALAYFCAGGSNTTPAEARSKLLSFVEDARASARADTTIILLTASGSTKGDRYAIATVKPYQGQRANSRRPEQWRYLRTLLEDGTVMRTVGCKVETYTDREADDGFAMYSNFLGWEHTVIMTQDKDMRMVPGLHMDWVDRNMVEVPPTTWARVVNDKLYGRLWFWMQLLHGDTADNIPGLPKVRNAKGDKFVACGPARAEELLGGVVPDRVPVAVFQAYVDFYKEEAEERFVEQAALLWMRPDADADVCSFMQALPSPLANRLKVAADSLCTRVADARNINALAALVE